MAGGGLRVEWRLDETCGCDRGLGLAGMHLLFKVVVVVVALRMRIL